MNIVDIQSCISVVSGVQHTDLTSYTLCYAHKCIFHSIVLCLSFTWLNHSVSGRLYLPFPFTHFAHPLILLPSGYYQLSVFIGLILLFVYFFICFVFQIPYVSEIIWYLSFSVWLISLSITCSIYIIANSKI